MRDLVQVNAEIPRVLKLRLFSVLARRDQKFTKWLTHQAETWLRQAEASPGLKTPRQEPRHERD